ncbi:MAG: AHH domain-containing protein [Pseudomonadota bacterium]
MAEALHPRNIAATAQAVWEGARAGAEAVGNFVEGLPDAARELYAGTVRIIENANQIADFLGAFITGDWRGVEDFVINTLPRLIEDDSEAAQWRAFIINNAEAWQVVLEIVGYTKGPALLVAACAGICAAVPPQVWAQWGVASVAVISIEVVISAVIGFLAAAATALSGGAASAGLAAVVVGRTAKWARLANNAAQSVQNIMKNIDGLIDRIVMMGQASVRGRRPMTTDAGRRDGGTGQESEQRRENEDGRCRNCGARLGVGRHPDQAPNFRNGRTSKDSGYRGRIIAHAQSNRSSIASTGLIGDAAAHHLISSEGLSSSGYASKLERLGYDMNVVENLALIPSNGFVACHLKCQLHRGDHSWGAYNYHQQVAREIDDITGDLTEYCLQRPPTNDIQPDMDRKSALLATKVDRFRLPLTRVHRDFKSDQTVGCSNVESVNHTGADCVRGRDHSGDFQFAWLALPYTISAGK